MTERALRRAAGLNDRGLHGPSKAVSAQRVPSQKRLDHLRMNQGVTSGLSALQEQIDQRLQVVDRRKQPCVSRDAFVGVKGVAVVHFTPQRIVAPAAP